MTLKASITHVRCIDNKIGKIDKCRSCSLSKSARKCRKSVYFDEKGPKRPLQKVYSDIVGSMKCKSNRKARYFVTQFDSYSGYSIVRFTNRKREAVAEVMDMIQEL